MNLHALKSFLLGKRPKKSPVMRLVDDGVETYHLAKMEMDKLKEGKK